MDYAIQQVTAKNLDEIGLFCSRSKRKETGIRQNFNGSGIDSRRA
jgi:hypothetical protein